MGLIVKYIKYSFFIFAIISLSSYTMSEQKSAGFQVKVQIIETCDIATGSTANIDFGTVSRKTKDVQSTGILNISCTTGTPYSISLNSDGILENIQNPSLTIPYKLYQDASLNKEWGSSAENHFSQNGNGEIQSITIWGKIPDTNIPAGEYIDQVTATVTY